MTTSTALPILDREQWLAARGRLMPLPATGPSATELAIRLFGPCPPPPVPSFKRTMVAGRKFDLFFSPSAARDRAYLKVSDRYDEQLSSSALSEDDLRALADACTRAADYLSRSF